MRDRVQSQFYHQAQSSAVDIPLPLNNNDLIFELPPMPTVSTDLESTQRDLEYSTRKYEERKKKRKLKKSQSAPDNVPDLPTDFGDDINAIQDGEVEM